MLINEHKDYGMPVLTKDTKNYRDKIFEYDFIKNLFPTVKDYKPGYDFYLYSVIV